MASPHLCVYCRKKPVEHAWRPFCSERCRLLDLANWADGAYRLPVDEKPTSPDDEADEADGHDAGGR